MPITKILTSTISVFFLFVNTVAASCFQPYYTFTEVLANQEDSKHIFTCEILATYISGRDGYTSIAVVNQSFKGNPHDTVYITSGGFTSRGGGKMLPTSEWLIISDVKNNNQYTATICENLSQQLSKGSSTCVSDKDKFGEEYLFLLDLFKTILEAKYSGDRKIYYKGELRAQGSFLNGKSQGRWEHYGYGNVSNPRRLFSIVEYKNGKIEGLETRYDRSNNYSIHDYQRIIKNGKAEWVSDPPHNWEHTYLNDKTKHSTYSRINEKKDTTWLFQNIEFYIDSDHTIELRYPHGRFFRIDSLNNMYDGVGQYYRGAKVGNWRLSDKHGNFTESINYPYPDTSNAAIIAFSENGTPLIVKTKSIDGTKVKWRYYDKPGRSETEWELDEDGKLLSSTFVQREYRRTVSTYKNGKIHGTVTVFDTSDRFTSKIDYAHGNLEGNYIEFDTTGAITEITHYKNQRPTTIFSNSTYAPKVDGFYNGKQVQLNPYDQSVLWEGEYWMGYLVGENINYKQDGAYSISFYSTDHQEILNACQNNGPNKIEYYDKDGRLTMTFPKE